MHKKSIHLPKKLFHRSMSNFCRRNSEDSTILTEDQIQILLKNTPFDRDEINEWHREFLADVPNGRMGKYKLIQFYKLIYPNGKCDKFCKRVFKVYDRDGSGKIDFVELMLSISITASTDIHQKLSLAFQLFDIDKSGTIEREELTEVIQSIYDMTIHEKDFKRRVDIKELVDEIMEKFDDNKDGYLVKEEFFQGCINNPSLAELIIPY